ncbi:DUF4850 domain-containing protein [Paenibacillus donghaensis]|uniref:DUF4850 domain-containing protein n=1 Tax=Paenibacillus donghaensis TaxID=414771 RepID=A0A2Z2KPS1_9BACL|nr:DUF4850 domain-containing protein [Paenibacillus donghaensis]ASA20798.1 hypothetical protein B9T62_08375 [Paenibacillus donghaensis]
MNKNEVDWDKELKGEPFSSKHFTPQMQQQVEQRLEQKRKFSFTRWSLATAGCALMVVALWLGYSHLSERAVVPPLAEQADPGMDTDTPAAVGWLSFPVAEGGSEKVRVKLNHVMAEVYTSGEVSRKIHSPAKQLPAMTFPLPKDVEGRLEATWVTRPDLTTSYLLLAPAGWAAKVSIAENGSYGVTFQDPDNPAQSLKYTDNNWGCAGCAIGSIGSYFPDQASWADGMGFPVYEPLAFTKHQLLGESGADSRTARYTLELNDQGIQHQGAAYYDVGEWGYLFRLLEMKLSLQFSQSELVESILGFFAANHGPLAIPGAEEDQANEEYTLKALKSALEEQGMELTAVGQHEEHQFNKKLAGVWPDELLVDESKSADMHERLSVYAYGNAEECAAGLEALKLEINRTTYDGGARIYPHVFRGANFLVAYWTRGNSEVAFSYDRTIKQTLRSFES